MLVLVTGGTGYVGACAVARLLEAGHDVRLLVRRPEQVATSLAPYGLGPDDLEKLLVGDVRDGDVVETSLSGCDAVVHAAAVFSFDARRGAEALATNARATEVVLGTACRLGLEPVVHVSSTVVLVRHGGGGPDLPLGDVDLPYTRSKVDSERVARRLQDEGYPVVSIYPGAVFGPHDPYRGEQSERLRWAARGWFPLWPRGHLHSCDVRDVARVVCAVLEPGRGARRYVVPGHPVDAAAYFGALERAQGRRRPHLSPPTPVLRAMTRSTGALHRLLPRTVRVPTDREALEVYVRDTRFDDGPARRELGIEPLPFEQSVHDTLAWLAESGRLPRRYGPKEPITVA